MFCDKENINILTALLIAHGVKKAVVCPGSRNAAIVHNLNESGLIACYPVTDERSAGFYALGLSLADNAPVVACVTSGTALLNVAPAVAEATYRHHGLIVVSADRPQAWIGQLDGQTMSQQGAFGSFVGKSVTLPEPHDDIERWHCERLVNETLLSVKGHGCMSVHINVPVSEPLFSFTNELLPSVKAIECIRPLAEALTFYKKVIDRFLDAKRPMVVVGQISKCSKHIDNDLRLMSKNAVVLSECLSSAYTEPFDMALKLIGDDERYLPDFILYFGDTLVSKRVKRFLRRAKNAECWAVSPDGEVHDVFMNLAGVLEGNAEMVMPLMADPIGHLAKNADALEYVALWREQVSKVAAEMHCYEPRFSQMAAVREFEMSLDDMDYGFHVHYANSMSVRLACLYAGHYVWCNRGINGIEGSLSTAAGFSLATSDMVFCVIGDLSFFYDSNALWNQNIRGNLRVLLLNNGGGGIFASLNGLQDSPAYTSMVAARHKTTAKGLCESYDVGYLSARTMDELRIGLATLMTAETKRPMVLEVFTDVKEDRRVIDEYIKNIR